MGMLIEVNGVKGVRDCAHHPTVRLAINVGMAWPPPSMLNHVSLSFHSVNGIRRLQMEILELSPGESMLCQEKSQISK